MKQYMFSEPPDAKQAAWALAKLGPPVRKSPNGLTFCARFPIMFVSAEYHTVGYTSREGYVRNHGIHIPWSRFKAALT